VGSAGASDTSFFRPGGRKGRLGKGKKGEKEKRGKEPTNGGSEYQVCPGTKRIRPDGRWKFAGKLRGVGPEGGSKGRDNATALREIESKKDCSPLTPSSDLRTLGLGRFFSIEGDVETGFQTGRGS